MGIFTKKRVTKPVTNEVHCVGAVQLWYVEWSRRYGSYSGNVEKCIEAFPRQEDAEAFAESLCAAFKLLRHTDDTRVTVSPKTHQVDACS